MENEQGQHIGELDLVLVGVDRQGHRQVVAVVEMKSNFYDIGKAFSQQHAGKLCCRSTTVCWRTADGGTANPRVKVVLRRVPYLFIATLVPDRPYLAGADSGILEPLVSSSARCGMAADSPSQEEVRRLYQQLQNSGDALGLALAPCDVVAHVPAHVLVVV